MLKKALITGLLVGMSSVAMAGPWTVKAGVSLLNPTQETKLNAATVVKADDEVNFTPSVEYSFANSPFSVELLLAAPFKQDVKINGANAVELKHLPPTLTAKYNFQNSSRFTPYIGVGATAFIPWDVKGVQDVKEDFGFAGQIGFNFQPADAKNWGVFVDVRYADLNPEVKVDSTTKFNLDIDPVVYTLGYSYNF
ncbi:OmpW/AlkL family protein [Acinetobacter populi]|uniref:OmpW family protein n=1 Tax=Acinetobacter populi TaxID=1582270 RepID=A0A1Z9Z3K5_9GAMM|nr:OmpW family outer membrane protein [Acinetobacter populi]OUY08997.1 hypothetical protein CAP51_05175 [Acinetobacter populi]